MDHTVFNSRSLHCKAPYGAVPCHTKISVVLRPLIAEDFLSCGLVLLQEFAGIEEEIPLSCAGTEADRTVFAGTFSAPDEPELCWYYFHLVRENGQNVYLGKNGYVLEEGQEQPVPWQQTVYDGSAHTPDWFGQGVTYQIFPDRFCRGETAGPPDPAGMLGDRLVHQDWGELMELPEEQMPYANRDFFGGTLRGIEEKLEYLRSLHVTTVYLCPIFEADSNHRYNTGDYETVDPMLGTAEDFERLCRKAGKLGMHVMLDGVFNHCGYYFMPWQDVLAKGPDSRYFDWFMINKWPINWEGGAAKKGELYTFAFFDNMPKLNTSNPEVRQYFVDICAGWVENYKIDGLRLDVANEVSHVFCKELHTRIKEINPEIYILGEIWHNAMPWLRGDEFDAVMNYPLGESIKDFWIDKSLTNEDFEFTINRCYTSYMQQTNDVLFNLLDSHDTKRLRSDVKNLDEYFAQLAVLFAMPGSPCIFYGTEIAMEGSYDPDCRRCMPWEDIESGKYKERTQIISTLIRLRKQEPLLKSRNFHFPNEYSEYGRVIQFQKVDWKDCSVEVITNCCEEDVEVPPQGEILLERHYIDSTLLSNGILIRKIKK